MSVAPGPVATEPLDEMTAEPVDPVTFRVTMASVPTPVVVVTAVGRGRPHGTTVSAFMSVSAEPPLVAVALDRGSALLALLEQGDRFGINVLTGDQSRVAQSFARKGADRFSDVLWHLEGGAPRLQGPGGWLLCEAASLVEAGDHVLVLGTVVSAVPAAGPPLTYHDRGFGTHLPLHRA